MNGEKKNGENKEEVTKRDKEEDIETRERSSLMTDNQRI